MLPVPWTKVSPEADPSWSSSKSSMPPSAALGDEPVIELPETAAHTKPVSEVCAPETRNRPKSAPLWTPLGELVAAAERGEVVVIARNGRPAVRLVSVVEEHSPVRLGSLAGQIELAGDFDEPLPEFEPYVK
jgi:antitoxin (DNA-binding transcriptional repressor) of toxin-antitoxin stability system